jgi:hypothetical protein
VRYKELLILTAVLTDRIEFEHLAMTWMLHKAIIFLFPTKFHDIMLLELPVSDSHLMIGEPGSSKPPGGEHVDKEEEEEEEAKPEPVTLVTFRRVLDRLQEQRAEMEALPSFTDTHVIRVDLTDLKEALLPAPSECLAAMHEELPRLAADLLTAFISEVQNALTRLAGSSVAVEDYVDKIEFLQQVSCCI